MRSILFTFLSLFSLALCAQNFEKFYRLHQRPAATTMNIPEEAQYAIPDGQGNFFITGMVPQTSGSGQHPYLLKIDSNGDSLWSKLYDYLNGGTVFHFRENGNNELEIYASVLTFDPGPNERAMVVRLNKSNGDTLGTQLLAKHPTCNNLGQYLAALVLPDGSQILSFRDMQAGAGAASNIGKIYKVTTNNSATWNFQNDTTPNSYQYFYDLLYDGNNIIGCGGEVAAENQYEGEFCLTSVDTSGSLNWSTTLTSPKTPWNNTRWFGLGFTVVQNSQGEYLAGGLMKFTEDVQPNAGVVVKFSANGDSLSASRFPFSRDILDIQPDGNGAFVVAGTGLTDTGQADAYLDKALFARLSDNGQLNGKMQFGDTNKVSTFVEARYYANSVLPLGGNDFLLLGSGFKNSINANRRVSMVVGFTASGLSEPGLLPQNKLAFFPNPASQVIFLPALAEGERVSIYNPMGQLVKSTTVNRSGKINVGSLPNGNYFLEHKGSSAQLIIVP